MMEQKKAPTYDERHPTGDNVKLPSYSSFLSRIGASASGLVQDALSSPHPASLGNELERSVASSTKGSTSGSAGPSAASMSLQASETIHPSMSQDRTVGSSSREFRREPCSGHVSAARDRFEAFLSLQEEAPFDVDQNKWGPSAYSSGLQRGDFGDLLPGRSAVERTRLASQSFEDARKHWPDSDPADGAAVVALLSDPSFCIDDLPSSPSVSDDSGYGSHANNDLAQSIIPKASSNPVEPLSTLSLVPDLGKHSTINCVEEAGGYLISKTEQHDSDFDLQPWIDMLTTYHEEVWGNLSPLVQDAVKEANVIRDGDHDRRQECPAIRRLAMVVGHISHGAGE